MNTLPTIFTEPTFGDLVTLPTVYQQNQSLLERAKAQCEPVKAAIPADLTKPTPDELEALDSQLNGLQVKLASAATINEDRRKVFTSYFDKIKGVFTGQEKELIAIKEGFKVTRDAIARERANRSAKAQREQEEAIQKKQELVMLRTNWVQMFTGNLTRVLAEQVSKLNENFNSKTAEELDAYGSTLKKWNPVYKVHEAICFDNNMPVTVNAEKEVGALYIKVKDELFDQFNTKYVQTMFAERDRLIELIPSRINELKTADAEAIAARLAKEKKDAEDKLALELKQQEEQIQAQGQAEQLNATFEVAATAEIPIEQTKGAVKKLNYSPTTHAAWIALIQSWVQNDLPGMSLEEIAKKLNFVLVAGNKKLNAGVKLEARGLEVIEDISTRTRKK